MNENVIIFALIMLGIPIVIGIVLALLFACVVMYAVVREVIMSWIKK